MSRITKLNKGMKNTLTVDSLTEAIINGIDRYGMPEDEARGTAEHILNFFGYGERIIDNILEPGDRDIFYLLEDTGILTTEREETSLYDGREWRIHYWKLQRSRVIQLVEKGEERKKKMEDPANIYEEIPDDVWTSRTLEME